MKQEVYIKGYRLTTPLTNDSSGNGRWGYAEKDGIPVFIKEFLSPKYPMDPTLFSETSYRRNRNICLEFQERKSRLYRELLKCVDGQIIPVIDFFRLGTKYYMVTERVDKVSFSVQELAALPFEQKIILMKLISYSICELHRHAIVHADLKPDNILIKRTRTGGFTAKIIDFDGSFLQPEIPAADEVQGDLVYLAPETYWYMAGEMKEITVKIDVFAMGVFFYQILCGVTPRFAYGAYEYPFEAVLDQVPLLFPRNFPLFLSDLLSWMLERNPQHRCSMEDVLRMLDQIIL